MRRRKIRNGYFLIGAGLLGVSCFVINLPSARAGLRIVPHPNTQIERDQSGQTVKVVEPGRSWEITYDEEGRVGMLKESAGWYQLVEYGSEGNLRKIYLWDSDGLHTTYTCSRWEILIEEGPPMGPTETTIHVDLLTGRRRMRMRNGASLDAAPQTNGDIRLVSRIPGQAPIFSIIKKEELSQDGHLKSTRQDGAVYDENGRIVEYTNAFGNLIRYEYDKVSRTIRKIFPNNESIYFKFDDKNRLIRKTFPLGRVVSREYGSKTEADRITLAGFETQSWFEPEGENIATFESDIFGSWSFTRWDSGRLLVRSDPSANLTYYLLDEKSRIVRKETEDGQILGIYVYDQSDNLTEAHNEYCALSCGYDPQGRITSVRDDGIDLTMQYRYDDAGALLRMIDSEGHDLHYSYDNAGRLEVLRSSRAGTFRLKYNQLGRPVLLSRPNGVRTEWSYDQGGRILECRHILPRQDDLFVTYRYDKMGNVIEVNDSRKGRVALRYDQLSQLAGVDSEPDGAVKMVFDAWGNLLSSGGKILTHDRPGQPTGLGEIPVECDVGGRVIRFSRLVSSYDVDNRLISDAVEGTEIGKWRYGPLGNLVLKIDEAGREIRYSYAQGRLYGVKNADRDAISRYIMLPGMKESAAVIREDGTVVYPLCDPMGTITDLTDAEGELIASRSYSLWGAVRGTDPLNVDTGFCGRLPLRYGRSHFTELARALAPPAIPPGFTGLHYDNPVSFMGANPYSRLSRPLIMEDAR